MPLSRKLFLHLLLQTQRPRKKYQNLSIHTPTCACSSPHTSVTHAKVPTISKSIANSINVKDVSKSLQDTHEIAVQSPGKKQKYEKGSKEMAIAPPFSFTPIDPTPQCSDPTFDPYDYAGYYDIYGEEDGNLNGEC
jgi:hypothetical protein